MRPSGATCSDGLDGFDRKAVARGWSPVPSVARSPSWWRSALFLLARPRKTSSLRIRFASLEWTFARVRYDAWTLPPGRRYDIFDEPWTIDFPAADQNLSRRVKTVTSIQVHEPVVISLEDPNLWNYPWIYIVEPGNLRLKEAEVPILREFLLRGGTLTFDDFHGPIEWLNLERELKRVFPDRKIIDLPLEHPIFHCFYDFSSFPQTPGLGSFLQGRTWEKGGYTAHLRGIEDDAGRDGLD